MVTSIFQVHINIIRVTPIVQTENKTPKNKVNSGQKIAQDNYIEWVSKDAYLSTFQFLDIIGY